LSKEDDKGKEKINEFKKHEKEISFFSDGTVIKDKNLSGDIFMSLLHYQRKKAALLMMIKISGDRLSEPMKSAIAQN